MADSKQVAVLVPTTILALQHYNTFKNRLKDFPCNIDYVSRLRTAKEVAEIQKKLKAGTLDIVIGTHKLIGKGFEFKDLGLLVIDEEQKFGVSAKEKLRQLKASVDTLTLTATPIPRTLQFSLLGARDLSIINTPPPNRIPVQTESSTLCRRFISTKNKTKKQTQSPEDRITAQMFPSEEKQTNKPKKKKKKKRKKCINSPNGCSEKRTQGNAALDGELNTTQVVAVLVPGLP